MNFAYSVTNNVATITDICLTEISEDEDAEHIIIPDNIDGYPCVCIDLTSTLDKRIKSIKMGENIRVIESECFAFNTSINCIDLNKTKIVKKNAFARAINLSKVYWGTNLEIIESSAFKNTAIEEAILPDSLTSIGSEAFYSCKKLNHVRWPSSISSIPTSCFSESSISCIENIEHVTSIGVRAFSQSKITDITNFKNLKFLADAAFAVTPLHSVVSDTISNISKDTFYKCKELTEVKLNSPLFTTVPSFAFADCSSLTSVDIPNLRKIDSNGFGNDKNLTNFNFSEELKIISESAFFGSGLIKANLKHVSELGKRAFGCCKNLTTVYWPDNIPLVPPFTFAHCKSLEKITNCTNITRIMDSAFEGTSSLHELFLGSKIEEIGGKAFKSSGLHSIAFNSNYIDIKSFAFENCQELLNVLFVGKANVGSKVFAGCNSLEEINNSENILNIPSGLFEGAKNLKEFKFNENIAKISKRAFKNSGLVSACLPLFCKKVEKEAFMNCTKLKNVIWSPLCQYFSKRVFYNCINLNTIERYQSITNIEYEAFYNTCINSMTFGCQLSHIGYNAFSKVTMDLLNLASSSIYDTPTNYFSLDSNIKTFYPPFYA